MLDLLLYLFLGLLPLLAVLCLVSKTLHFYLLRLAQGLTPRPPSLSSGPQAQWTSWFNKAGNSVLCGPVFIDNNGKNASVNITSVDGFMVSLLKETIPGAEFGSSARDPPPRCHPETRLAISNRCVDFIFHCTGEKKIRWVFGTAGAGKSAVMQSVAEHSLVSMLIRVSVFFFWNGRSDGSKTIVTLAYQPAVQCEPYRQFIKQKIAHDLGTIPSIQR